MYYTNHFNSQPELHILQKACQAELLVHYPHQLRGTNDKKMYDTGV